MNFVKLKTLNWSPLSQPFCPRKFTPQSILFAVLFAQLDDEILDVSQNLLKCTWAPYSFCFLWCSQDMPWSPRVLWCSLFFSTSTVLRTQRNKRAHVRNNKCQIYRHWKELSQKASWSALGTFWKEEKDNLIRRWADFPNIRKTWITEGFLKQAMN